MVVVRTLDELAKVVGGDAPHAGAFQSDGGGYLNEELRVEGLVADHVILDRLASRHPLTLSRCSIDRLHIRRCVLGDGLEVVDSTVGAFDMRSCKNASPVAVRTSRVLELRVHALRAIDINEVDIPGACVVSSPQGGVELANTRAGEVRIEADTPNYNCSLVRLRRVDSRGSILLQGLLAQDVRLEQVAARRIEVRHISLRTLVLDETRSEGIIRLAGLSPQDADTAKVVCTGRAERFEAHTLRGAVAELGQLDTDLLSLRRGRFMLDEVRTSLLRLGKEDDAPSVHVSSRSQIQRLEIFDPSIRRVADVAAFATKTLGGASSTELDLLHRSMDSYPPAQDLVFVEMSRRAANSRGWAGLPGRVFGEILGWGVLLLPPIITLAVFVLATAGVLLVGQGAETMSPGSTIDSLVVAAALWMNVGTGLSAEMDGMRWTAAATACTAVGMVLITAAVGIAIRKLVR